MCVQLAKKIGLRASIEALKIVLDWLSISVKLPDWTTVRTWLCRMGVDALKHARERHEDWICFVDHSNQIGKEKVLAVLGVRACHLPPRVQTLCSQHVRVLRVLWHLDHPASEARQGITVNRMDEKLGWLRMHREGIAQWRRIEGVISESLCLINTQGLYRGTSSDLQLRLDGLCQANGGHCERSAEMAHSLIEFVSSSKSQLAEGERGWELYLQR